MAHGHPRPVSCYRLPALVATKNSTLLAFASARNWTGDGCQPLRPVNTKGTQRLAVRVGLGRIVTLHYSSSNSHQIC